MSIAVSELTSSRGGAASSPIRRYSAVGSNDDAAIIAAVLAEAPVTHNGYPRRGVSNLDLKGDRAEVQVQYGSSSYSGGDPGSKVLFSFSTMNGGTQHITQFVGLFKSATADWTPYPTAPNCFGTIGANGDGSVNGTDVPLPGFAFTLRRKMLPGEITQAYIATCYTLTCRINSSTWSFTADLPDGTTLTLTFAEGEVLFYGVEAPEPNNDGSIYITYHFAANPNLDTFSPGSDFSSTIALKGWDHVFYRYATVIDSTAHKMITRASDVYAGQVIADGDLSLLGLPA